MMRHRENGKRNRTDFSRTKQSSTKPKQKMYKSITTSLAHHVTFVLPLQSYCARFVDDDTSAWVELVLWTYGRQSGHNSVSVSFCWVELTPSKFEIIIW